MKKLIPLAFFALLALNTNALRAANSTSTIVVPATELPAAKTANATESTKLNKENVNSEVKLSTSDTSSKMNDTSTMSSKDNAGIYISSGAALIIIVILLIILL